MQSRVLPASSGALVPDDERLNITGTQWAKFIGLVAQGVDTSKAIEKSRIHPALLEGVLRTVPERHSELKDAKLAAARKDWDYETVYAICDEIAISGDIQAACKARGKPVQGFLQLALRDPVIKDLYDTAQKLRAELWNAEVIRLADDKSDDFTLDGKGNPAAVRRSDLQVQTRLKLMSHYDSKKYGGGSGKQEVNVNVNFDAAERLNRARKRVKKHRTQVIEGEFTPVKTEDEDWLK